MVVVRTGSRLRLGRTLGVHGHYLLRVVRAPFVAHVGRERARPAAPAERAEARAELLAEGAVDDKVEAGVGLHQQVADVEVVEVCVAADVARVLVQQLVAERRRLADDEDEHDDHHDERQVVFLAVRALR